MKNISIRLGISILYFSVSLFVTAIIFTFINLNKDFNYIVPKDYKLYFTLINIVISCTSLFAAILWQTTNFLLAKKISYFTVILLILTFPFFVAFNDIEPKSILQNFLVIVFPALFIFLPVYSKASTLIIKKNNLNEKQFLDSDLVVSEKEKESYNYFWKLHHLISLCLFLFSTFFFIVLMIMTSIDWTYLLPAYLLLSSILIWMFPKTGNWIFSLPMAILGTFIILIYPLIIYVQINDKEEIEFKGQIFAISVTLFMIGLSMTLLSKESRAEWKK